MHRHHSYYLKYCHNIPTKCGTVADPLEWISRIATANVMVIFSRSSCCLCHAVKQLFSGMGVNSTVYELDEYPGGKDFERALMRLVEEDSSLPVVFIGGKLVGGIDRIIGSHINGTLLLLLKEAGALWL